MAESEANSNTTELARQIVQGTQSSLPLAEALFAAAEGTADCRLAKSLKILAERIQTGEPLPQILTENSPLPPSLSGLLKASLATGEPARAITEWLVARDVHWRNVMQALIYPLATLAGTYLLFLFMAFHLVPVFLQIGEGMQYMQRPGPLQAAYQVLQQGAPLSLMMLFGVAVVLLLVRAIGGARGWSQFMSALPLLGPLWLWSGSSELFRALAILLERKIALPEALRLTGSEINDAALAQHCRELALQVEQGATLSNAIQTARELPESTVPLIRVGEKSGTLAAACRTAAEMLETRLAAQANLVRQLAPTAIILLTLSMYASMAAACIMTMQVFVYLLNFAPATSATLQGTLANMMVNGVTISWTILLLPGICILIALQIFYRKRVISSNVARLLLATAAWLMILLGLVGGIIALLSWLSLFFLPIVLLALFMMVDRYRRGEHHALLNSLAFAAEKGIPLPEIAQAFATENVADAGARAQYLSGQLEAGATLSAATRGARLRLSTPQRLAVNLSDVLVARGVALRSQLNWGNESDSALRVIVNRLFYLCGVALVTLWIFVFLTIKIVPVFQKMFEEFGFDLPAPTLSLIRCSRWFAQGGFLLIPPLFAVVMIAFGVGMTFYTGWYDFAVVLGTQARRRYALVPDVTRVMDLFIGLRYIFWRYDASLVLRSLSLLLAQRVPLPQALTLLANVYPRGNVRRRLTRVALDVERGGDWLRAMQRQWLLGATEVAVLQSAARAGNLPWALEEMGDSLMRRLTYRLTLLHQILYPILLLLFAAVVAFVAIALIMPLIALIQGLA